MRAFFADGGYVSDQGDYVGLFPSAEFRDFLGKIKQQVEDGIRPRALLQVVAGGAFPVSLDSAGRVLLPGQYRDRFSADGDVQMVGSVTHLCLYRPDAWTGQVDLVGDLGQHLVHIV